MKPIFLIGMPASGKTTLGYAASQALGLRYIDLDNEIEKASGMNICEIFDSEGEQGFRRREREALTSVIALHDTIISTGGGTPCNGDNLDKMIATGTVIALDASTQTLTRRITEAEGQRPAFNGKCHAQIYDSLKMLKEQRQPFYSQAHFTINGALLETPAQIAYTVRILQNLLT